MFRMKFIKNVKVSVKYLFENTLTHFANIADKRETCVKHIRNFLIIKDVYSLTIFNQPQNKYHVNVTGIKTINEVKDAICWLEQIYCKKEFFDFISCKIDNITSCFNSGRKLSLHSLANIVPGISYNPERFHALYLKTDKGTIIAFQSGKLNILGCKSLEHILELWTLIKRKLNAVHSSIIS